MSPEDRAPLRSVDAAERAFLIKALVLFSGPCFVILSGLWYFLAQTDVISSRLALILTVINVPISVLAAFALNAAVGRGSTGLMNTIYAWGGSAPMAVSYPRQDAMIARGAFSEAAEYFRDHIRVTPEDCDARLRLATLVERHLKDNDEAERLYLEVRRLAVERDHQFAASNGLIDLYRRSGRLDRLRVELARFAERYRGTAAGQSAAAELRELKVAGP